MIRIKKHLIFWGFIFLFIPFTSVGQRYISGRITDAEDGKPILAATVFIANTTVGTTTDLDGYYRLNIPGEGNYRLSISHVGYQSTFYDIESGKVSLVFDVAMNIHEIDEVTVASKVRARQRDITLFWRTLLGEQPSHKTIYAVNPESAYYFYNSKTKVLKVSCREPLQIINNKTGYQIQLILDHFTHDYKNELTSWKFEHIYTELKPDNPRQQIIWENNRKNTYLVSMTNFIKSLYHNSLTENGFLLTYPQKTDVFGNTRNLYADPEAFLSFDSNADCKTFRIPSGLKDLMLVCFGEPITQSTLEDVNRTQDGLYRVPMTNTGNRSVANKQTTGYQWPRIGLFRNIIETPNSPVCIYPDGTVSSPIKLSPFSSNSMTGLNMMLPFNYNPDMIASDNNENEPVSITNNPLQITDKIFPLFNEQLEVFPMEKIHLHTDRDVYISGEKIWFKAYVVDAHTHLFPTPSRYAYVELISPVDSLMYRVMVRETDGMFYGNLPLTEYVPTGNYTLRAYTRYMENVGDDYFFKKNIQIQNLDTHINQQRPTAHRGLLKDDFDVSFFPEGGNLIEGVINKVAFKALNNNGYPETISGMLIDDNGIEITSAKTFYAGMGVFEFKPETGEKIRLKCKNVNGLEKTYELPQPESRTYSLNVDLNNTDIRIKINPLIKATDIHYYLLAHCRGEILYFSEWDKKKESVLFTEEEFPAGIIQFVLFDEQLNPLSERLVFNKNYEEAKVEFHTDKAVYEKREKVRSTLKDIFPSSLEKTEGEAERVGEGLSHFSISVTDDKDIAVDSSTTILSSLLLSSELKGYIENPAWYLQDNNISATALDLLMMIHGWRRYNIPEIIKGTLKFPQIPFQTSQTISGKVKSMTFSGSANDSEVSILMKDGDYGITSTDKDGVFRFYDFEYPDSTSYFIQALNRKGSNSVELVLDGELFPKLIHATQSLSVENPTIMAVKKIEPEINTFIAKAAQRSKYDEDLWVIHLGEVEVTARRIEKKEEQRNHYWANAGSEITIRKEDIERIKPRLVSDLLRNIPGVRVFPDGTVNIGQSMSFSSSTLPLVIIDGFPVTWDEELKVESGGAFSPLERVSVHEVESIDIFKQHNAALFGARGANGVISITTKRGITNDRIENQEFNYTVYTPLGYQKPVEFYSPKYETLESKHLSIPDYRTTIFWKPDVVISADEEETTFDFYTSDFPTTYSVVIEGLTSDGRIVRQVEKIQVK